MCQPAGHVEVGFQWAELEKTSGRPVNLVDSLAKMGHNVGMC